MAKKSDFLENIASLNKYYHEFYPLIPGALFIGCLTLVYLGFNYLYVGELPEFGLLQQARWPVFAFIALFLVFASFVAGNIFNRLSPKDPDIFGIYHHNVQRIRDAERSEELLKGIPHNTDNGNTGDSTSCVYNSIATIVGVEGNGLPTPDLYFADRHWKLGIFHFSVHQLREIIDPDFKLQFPYPHLRQYLYYHNHGDLNLFVPWCWRRGGKYNSIDGSKQVINGLKHRILEANDPDINLKLVQTECQVRLMSSMWHVLRVVRIPAMALLGAVALSVIIGSHNYLKMKFNLKAFPCCGVSNLFSCFALMVLCCFLLRRLLKLDATLDTKPDVHRRRICCWLLPIAIIGVVVCGIGSLEGLKDVTIIKDIISIFTPRVHLINCLIVSAIGAFAYYIFLRSKYELEYSVHYMRSREIFDIIDFAHILSFKRNGSINQRFEDVIRKGEVFFDENCFKCRLCSNCHYFNESGCRDRIGRGC